MMTKTLTYLPRNTTFHLMNGDEEQMQQTALLQYFSVAVIGIHKHKSMLQAR